MKKLVFTLSFLFTLIYVNGQPQIAFQRTYGVDSLSDYAQSVVQTPDEGYLVAGVKQVIGSDWRLMLMKTDKYGNELWTKLFAYPPNSIEPYSIESTQDGNYIITGLSGHDVFLLKVDGQGNEIWHKIYTTPQKDWGWQVQQIADNGFIIGGWREQPASSVKNDMLLIRTNANGDTLWTRTYSNNGISSLGYAISQLPDSSIIIAGTTGSIDWDLYIVRVNLNGEVIWNRNFSIGGTAEVRDIKISDSGNIVITGFGGLTSCLNNPFLAEIDTDGNMLWMEIYDNLFCGWVYSLCKTNDGGYALFGIEAGTGYDLILMKTDSFGTVNWLKRFDEGIGDYGYKVRQTLDGGFIMTGHTSTSGQNPDVILIKTDSIGNNALGLEEINNTNFLIYPNPFSSQATLQTDAFLNDATLTIFNSFGQTVKQIKNISGQSVVLNREALQSGLYFLYLKQDNDVIAVKKLLIND